MKPNSDNKTRKYNILFRIELPIIRVIVKVRRHYVYERIRTRHFHSKAPKPIFVSRTFVLANPDGGVVGGFVVIVKIIESTVIGGINILTSSCVVQF